MAIFNCPFRIFSVFRQQQSIAPFKNSYLMIISTGLFTEYLVIFNFYKLTRGCCRTSQFKEPEN